MRLSSRFNELKKLNSHSVCRTHMTNLDLSKPRPKDCPHKRSKMWIIVLLLFFIGIYFHRFNQNGHLNYISIPSHRGVYVSNGYSNMVECSSWHGQERKRVRTRKYIKNLLGKKI